MPEHVLLPKQSRKDRAQRLEWVRPAVDLRPIIGPPLRALSARRRMDIERWRRDLLGRGGTT